MSTTYIKIKCDNCGYSYNRAIYGYVEDPIGIPLSQCPNCQKIYKDGKHREWIQMSPIGKFFSISPRGKFLAIFLTLIPIAFLIGTDWFDAFMSWCENAGIGAISVPLFLFVLWLVCYYIVACIRVNSWKFIDRVAASVARTRNESYAQLLEKFGKIYGEDIPKFILFSKTSQATIEYNAEVNKIDDFKIPVFSDSINNYQ